MPRQTARLLIYAPDARGIIAAVAGFIAEHGGNILEADQHTDPRLGDFFMRVEIDLDPHAGGGGSAGCAGGFDLTDVSFASAWQPVAEEFNMRWRVYWGNEVKRMALLVSKETHCLSDVLWRYKTGELDVELPFVAGNHEHLRDEVEPFGVRFHFLSITPASKAEQEAKLLSLMEDAKVDFLVLARYMQVLSSDFVARFPSRIINIHHSFLPAFAGPKPYHQAYERGVKLIGATSHYVTDELDQGPIIAQETRGINHRDTIDDLIRKGRDLERVVLATAIRQHVEDKILVSKNRTIVFD